MLRRNLQTRRGKCFRRARYGVAALLAFACLWAILAGAVPASAQDSSSKQFLTLTQYENELNRIANAFSELPAHPEVANSLGQSVPSAWTVYVGQEKFEVSAGWIPDALKAMEKKPSDRKQICEEAVNLLKSLRAEAERAKDAAVEANRADAKARLRQILRQREFNQVKGESWWSQMWDQVWRWVDWLLSHTLGRLLGNGTAKTVAIYAMIGVVFLFAAVWLVRGMRTLVRNDALTVSAVFPPGKHWRDWAREATTAASRGDYRAALHAAYWAGVYRMAELGAWQLDRARTPREYLRMIGEQSQAELAAQNPVGSAIALKALTFGMETSWYGFTPATAEDFEKAVSHLETLGCRFHSTAQTAKS